MVRPRSTCRRDQLEALLAGRLSRHEETALDGHLGECAECRATLEGLAADGAWWSDLRQLNESARKAAPGAITEDLALGFLEPSDAPDALGRLGPYEVSGVLGRGGFGVVLKAFDPALNRPVAIKVIAPELAASASARRRFAREARAAAAVVHEHVVAIHAVAESAGGLPYLVMPYVEGRSLQERLDATGPLDVNQILRIGMQTAAGLAAAHAQGLVHRDVKPANILLENGVERVKITDFGLARTADDASMSQSGLVVGTPQYMAPEQANGDAADPRADLFSLGSVLYAMATGRPPFRAETNMAVLRRVREDQPRPIAELNPAVPDWLAAIVAKLHGKDPDERFQTAAEVAALLERCLAYVERPGDAPVPFAASAPPRRPVRGRAVRWGVAAALAAVLGAIGMAEAAGYRPISALVATIVRIKTPEGVLVIEVDDPEVKITIDGEDLVITGPGLNEVRLAAGQHRVVATKGQKTVQTELITIQKGSKQVVTVRREVAPAAAGVAVAPVAPQRLRAPIDVVGTAPAAPQPPIGNVGPYKPGPPTQAPSPLGLGGARRWAR